MKLGRNLLAGLTNSVWSALINLAVVPLYLKYLGIEAYGLIGFFATTQVLFQLLDMGLAPTINREIARGSVSGNMREARNLLHTLAVVYWGAAVVIAIIIFSLAPFIARYWLQSKHISQEDISHAVMLMGLVIASRWPIGLYQGALMGAQRLTVSSGVNIVMATLGNLGAVAVLAYVSSTIQAFFIWQAGVGLVYATAMRWAAWRVVGQAGGRKFDVNELKRIWRFSVGMSAIALSSVVFTQMDKVILSKMLGLEEFGHYMLATAVTSGLYVLVMPLFNILYPRFSALVVSDDTKKLTDLYRLGTQLLTTVLFPIAMLLFFFGQDLVSVWTGNSVIAASAAPIIALLALGSALHGVMHLPYALQLAYGMTWLPLKINSILMAVLVPLIIICTLSYGARGAAMAWLILHILYVLLGTWMTHRRILKGVGVVWLLRDVGVPFLVSSLVGLLGNNMIHSGGYSLVIKLLMEAMLVLLASLLSFTLSLNLRRFVLTRLGLLRVII